MARRRGHPVDRNNANGRQLRRPPVPLLRQPHGFEGLRTARVEFRATMNPSRKVKTIAHLPLATSMPWCKRLCIRRPVEGALRRGLRLRIHHGVHLDGFEGFGLSDSATIEGPRRSAGRSERGLAVDGTKALHSIFSFCTEFQPRAPRAWLPKSFSFVSHAKGVDGRPQSLHVLPRHRPWPVRRTTSTFSCDIARPVSPSRFFRRSLRGFLPAGSSLRWRRS